MYVGYLQRTKTGAGYPQTEVINGFELPYGCWEPNSSTLQEQQVL